MQITILLDITIQNQLTSKRSPLPLGCYLTFEYLCDVSAPYEGMVEAASL